jgi:hypothetical protein
VSYLVDTRKGLTAMGDKAKKSKKGDKPKGDKKAKAAAPEAGAAGIVEELREVGAKLVAAANSPAGREAIAVGLSLAATAAQAALAAKTSRAKTKPEAAKSEPVAEKATPASSPGHDALAAALGNVAEMALAKIFPRKG